LSGGCSPSRGERNSVTAPATVGAASASVSGSIGTARPPPPSCVLPKHEKTRRKTRVATRSHFRL
jgi:hypothetical protein